MRRISKETETEIIVKAVYSVIVGMLVSQVTGWGMSLTACFACVLICYNNRGWYGTRTYYVKRMQTQVLMCILLFFALEAFRRAFPEAPLWLQYYVPVVLLAPLFLYLCYAHRFTPINLTAVFSALMIMGTGVTKPEYFTWRVVLTFLGLIFGWAIAVVYPFRSKLGRARDSLKNIARRSLAELELMAAGAEMSEDYRGLLKKEITPEMADIGVYLDLVCSDIKSPKYRRFAAQLPLIKAERAAAEKLIELIKNLDSSKCELARAGGFGAEVYREALRLGRLHISALDGAVPAEQEKALQISSVADSPFRVKIMSRLIAYKSEILKIAGGHNAAVTGGEGERSWIRKSHALQA